jgi:single-strand DNA-binding protein
MRVIVSCRLKQRSYETKEGEKRTVFEVEVDEVLSSASLVWQQLKNNS